MQPELFPDPEGLARYKTVHPPLFPHRFLRVRVAYEDLVFAALGSLLVLLAGFCLGVERGKLLVATRSGFAPAAAAIGSGTRRSSAPAAAIGSGTRRSSAPAAAIGSPALRDISGQKLRGSGTTSASSVAAPAAEATLPARELKGATPLQKGKLPSAGGYVIQLASFLDRTPAEREAKQLLRQGFTPQVIPQGRFFELRVVGFSSREEALGPSASLKKMYHDSFIKRVSQRSGGGS